MVSWTRSSARSCRPLSDTAKARSDGSVARSSRLNDGDSCMGLAALSLAGLLDLVQFLKQIQELVRNRLVLHRAVKSTQLGANIGIGTKPIFRAPRPRITHLIHLRFVFH